LDLGAFGTITFDLKFLFILREVIQSPKEHKTIEDKVKQDRGRHTSEVRAALQKITYRPRILWHVLH